MHIDPGTWLLCDCPVTEFKLFFKQVEKVCSPNSSAAPADDGADHVGGNEEPEREVHRSTSTSSGTRSLLWKMVIRVGTVCWTICLSTSQWVCQMMALKHWFHENRDSDWLVVSRVKSYFLVSTKYNILPKSTKAGEKFFWVLFQQYPQKNFSKKCSSNGPRNKTSMGFSHLLHASDHRSRSRSHLDGLMLLGVVGVGRAAQVEVREALLDRGLHPRASAPLHHDQVLIDHSLSWKSCTLQTIDSVDNITLHISCVIVQGTFLYWKPLFIFSWNQTLINVVKLPVVILPCQVFLRSYIPPSWLSFCAAAISAMSRIFVAILAQDPYLAAPVLPTSAQKVRQKHVTGTLDSEIRGGPLHIYTYFFTCFIYPPQ